MREASLGRTTLSRGGELSRGLEKETAANGKARGRWGRAGCCREAGAQRTGNLVKEGREGPDEADSSSLCVHFWPLPGCTLVALFLSCNLSGSAG